MNDFERKLAGQPFREPPPDLRAAILAGGESANVIVPVAWTWRDWFWPSPRAWAALAAVWLVFAALSFQSDAPSSPLRSTTQQPSASVTLLTFHQSRNFDHVLELPN